MDDEKPVLEQTTDAISSVADATKEAVKAVVKKVKKAARKAAKKVMPKKKAAKKSNAKKAAKNWRPFIPLQPEILNPPKPAHPHQPWV